MNHKPSSLTILSLLLFSPLLLGACGQTRSSTEYVDDVDRVRPTAAGGAVAVHRMSYRACGSDGNEYHCSGSTSFFLALLGVNGGRTPEFEVKGARDCIIHDVREAGSGRYQLLYENNKEQLIGTYDASGTLLDEQRGTGLFPEQPETGVAVPSAPRPGQSVTIKLSDQGALEWVFGSAPVVTLQVTRRTMLGAIAFSQTIPLSKISAGDSGPAGTTFIGGYLTSSSENGHAAGAMASRIFKLDASGAVLWQAVLAFPAEDAIRK